MSHGDRPRAPAFPSTRWSRLVVDPEAGGAAAREAFEALVRRYEGPIRAYVRARFARTDDDARDATQEFLVWMLERDVLGRADPARGSFRGFIKRTLANFLHDQERKRRTLKRGGHAEARSLDAADVAAELPDDASRSPEDVLDDAWRRELLAGAAAALEAELEERGALVRFRVFRDYFLGDEELDYAAVAERYGITKVDVSNHLTQAKKRYRAHLRDAVLETVGGDDDLRAELDWLFGGGE